jgi:hypothetical protein
VHRTEYRGDGVYRSNDPAFVPDSTTMGDATIDTTWQDPSYDGWNVYYKITAVDFSGNQSGPATPGTMTGVRMPAVPERYALYQNVPNPFNPSTSIGFEVPNGGGRVLIQVFDVTGRLVRTLLSGKVEAGRTSVPWQGLDNNGQPVSSGIYFVRMKAHGYAATRKMALLRQQHV